MRQKTCWGLALAGALGFGLLSGGAARAALFAADDFESYTPGQVESGPNNAEGTGLNGGEGFTGPYNIANAVKTLVTVQDRTSTPFSYTIGNTTLTSGVRALQFNGAANGSPVLTRPFDAQPASQPVYYGFLFRTNQGTPSPNQDFIALGLDSAAAGGTGGTNYDRVDLFVNPTSLDEPGTASATAAFDSGLSTVDDLLIRTVGLDGGDFYVIDNLRIATTFSEAIVVPEPSAAAALALAAAGRLTARRRRA